jgi:retron-type reverse transcriptase
MRKQLQISYQEIISLENLFAAWQEFAVGKSKKRDVQEFALRLADNILQLNQDLANFVYVHGPYKAFNISDPKPRNIHKATVRDRVLHHAIYRQLYPFFDRTFIADSYSCRLNKGVHKALKRFRLFGNQVSQNNTRTVWVLKCDIKKFFASIDHELLLKILSSYIPDQDILWLLGQVVGSFGSAVIARSPGLYPDDAAIPYLKIKESLCRMHSFGMTSAAGLPLGNLTSQLFCNIYMNEFDQFAKHKLKARYYVRYADDFVFLSDSREGLENLTPKIAKFLNQKLKLTLHPHKVFIKTLASGVDFLGWVNFSHYRILRNTTSRRMFKRIGQHPKNETLQSYLGLIKHGETFKVRERLLNTYGLWNENRV